MLSATRSPESRDEQPPTSSLSDLRGQCATRAHVDSSPPRAIGRETHMQPASQYASSSSSSLFDPTDQSTTPTPKSPFPKANLKPITSYSIPRPPDPPRSPASAPLAVPSNEPRTSPMLPPSSQTDSQPFPSTQSAKRTPAQIQANKERAQRIQREKAELKSREDTFKIKQERAASRKELATASLSKFGFSVASGMSRYGTGKGGTGDSDPTRTSDSSQDQMKPPEEWKPDERCSEEQKEVLEEVKRGGNVFFTGSAGVGKSFLLTEINRLLEHLKRPFQITATTGIAALQVNGTTIHSWAAVGLGDKAIHELYSRIVRNEGTKKNWTGIKTLIIDEISMSPAGLFDTLNILGKLIREDPAPFGGLQLIVCGDFYQLPPVPDSVAPPCMRCGGKRIIKIPIEEARMPYEERPKGIPPADIMKCVGAYPKKRLTAGGGGAGKKEEENPGGCLLEFRKRRFVFETDAWAECRFKVMELTKVFRQSDPGFIRVLEKIRRGVCDQECVDLFALCGSELKKGGTIQIRPTNLYPTRSDVDNENQREFKALKEEEFQFVASDESRGSYGDTQLERLNSTPAAKTLKLKKGAQVLLLANLNVKGGLVNGSRGVIVDWISAEEVPDEAAFGPIVQNGGPKKSGGAGRIGTEEWRQKAAEDFMDQQEKVFYPLVFFATGQEVIIRPHSWCIDFDKNNTVARTQIPLQLAWALTIHKSQGQSLDAVCVRLGKTFEKGQAYVALSRARTKEGLRVEGFKPGVVMAHPTVEIFYDCIAQKKSFFLSPVAPVNPLYHIPDFDPLIDKLKRKFGTVPPPLEQGSAVLVPGQKKPQHRDESQTQTQRPAAPVSTLSKKSNSQSWQEYIKLAAEKYVEATSGLQTGSEPIPMEPFLSLAGISILAALGKLQREDGVIEDGEGGTGTDSSGDSPMAIDGGDDGEDRKPKKKKRVRKGRVGH
ncbi:hypothetical protein JCM16303_005400 [Sporobolomyces ruberrimus]